MPMFDSDEAFEAYVARQQADLAEDQPLAASPAPQGAGFEHKMKVLGVVVPVALALVIGVTMWRSAPDGKSEYTDPWDKIFSATAWLGGRKYNANANSLTERMTFREPLEKKSEKP